MKTTTESDRPDQSAADRDAVEVVDEFPNGRETHVVAYDHDGDRYCPLCAKESDDIDRARYFYDETDVPAGGAVTLAMARRAGPDAPATCGGCLRRLAAFPVGGDNE